MSLTDKSALITGAGSGIGKATARLFSAQGANLVLLGRSLEPLERLAAELTAQGRNAIAIRADISDEADMQAAFDQIRDVYGRLDIAFANAGVNGTWAPLEKMTVQDWNHTMDVNLRGTFLTLHHTIPLMRDAGGSIIITSSINGTRTFTTAGATAYAATKAGQVALAKMAALELARYKIRVNAICPGRIESAIHDNSKQATDEIAIAAHYPDGDIPLTGGADGKPEDVAELVRFLASDAARHITGTSVFVDGGQSLLV